MKRHPSPSGLTLLTAAYNLPPWLTREIGRIVVHWAHFEFLVQCTVWMLLEINEKEGRVAAREPRIGDRFDMIKDLASIKNIKLSESSVNKLKIAAIRVSGWRDLLAHGVWGKDADGWKVQQTKGRHAKDAIVPHRSKRISPEGFLADAAGLQSITADVDRLIEEILPIRKTVKEQIAALIQKGPEQL